jgi:hypothetical protein
MGKPLGYETADPSVFVWKSKYSWDLGPGGGTLIKGASGNERVWKSISVLLRWVGVSVVFTITYSLEKF